MELFFCCQIETSEKRNLSHLNVLRATPAPPSGSLAGFMFKNCSTTSCAFLTKWIDLTKSTLEHQWPLWGIINLPKLTFLETKLDSHGSKVSKTKWDTYPDC